MASATPDPMKFQIAPHIVEDLGLNLYTSLPRVLAEFVANAYDADSPDATISMDREAISAARKEMRDAFEAEKAERVDGDPPLVPLGRRHLPDALDIVIKDHGHGMSRSDLKDKFLVAGRRRRLEEPLKKGRSPDGRPLMGRKGLGKLAGFGVAKVVEVTSRRKGEAHATKITLDYDELLKKTSTHEIEIPEARLDNGGGIEPHGTVVRLVRLLHDPMKSRKTTIENELADHFGLIDASDFTVCLNGETVKPASHSIAYAWPDPDGTAPGEFVEKDLERDDGGTFKFRYRMRFTGKNEALPAARRGVRVYAHRRLAAAPSLLGADTNMHGFRMTDYLDGVVYADFLDEEETDYIATDRQTLRWDAPLLAGLYTFLSDEIKEACKQCQKKRDADSPKIVETDPFTQAEIAKHNFGRSDRRMALRFAAILEGGCKRGVDDPAYKTQLPVLVRGVGHGNILTAISSLAEQTSPDLHAVAAELARLTKDELDQFISTVNGRLKGISALRKIVEDVDFASKENEREIQDLFEKSPWLIDPTYTQFLTADEHLGVLFVRLAKDLKIGKHAPDDAEKTDERPDLVFLLGNVSLKRLIIVELKSANLPLEEKHLTQLEYYMERAENWLRQQNEHLEVRGHLIGSFAKDNSVAKGVVVLNRRRREVGPETPWRVRDYLGVLKDTDAAHHELLAIHRRVEERAEEEEDAEAAKSASSAGPAKP